MRKIPLSIHQRSRMEKGEEKRRRKEKKTDREREREKKTAKGRGREKQKAEDMVVVAVVTSDNHNQAFTGSSLYLSPTAAKLWLWVCL